MEFNQIECFNCEKQIYFCYDEFGCTPYHLHCAQCDINIGAPSPQKAVELFLLHHKPHTLIEFYSNKIILQIEEGRKIIDLEVSQNGI